MKACDDTDGMPYGMCWRDMSNQKGYTPLSPEEADKVVDGLGALIGDGYRLRDIRRALS